jgi:hypothetical protein
VRVFDRLVFPAELHAAVNADNIATPTGVWYFDQTPGQVAVGATGGNHPTLLAGGARFTLDGRFAGGLRLDGTLAMASTALPALDADRSFTPGGPADRSVACHRAEQRDRVRHRAVAVVRAAV